MAELDLTKAKARAVEEAIGYVGGCICDEAWTSRKLVDPTCGWHLIEGLAEDIVNATLPHILDALAEQAAEDVPCDHGCAADTIPAYLREKAEEVRRG